jgi:hypothetical protein
MRFNIFNLYIEPNLDEIFEVLAEKGSRDELIIFSKNLLKCDYKEVLPFSLVYDPDTFIPYYQFRYYKGNKRFHFKKEMDKVPLNSINTSDIHSFFYQERL